MIISMKNRFEIRKDYLALFLFIAISVIVLFFCSKNSPFYVFNDWVDANAFFTMGKGMMNGVSRGLSRECRDDP